MLSRLKYGSPLWPNDSTAEISRWKLLEDSKTAVGKAGCGGEAHRACAVRVQENGDWCAGTTNPLNVLGDELLDSFPAMSLYDLVEPNTDESISIHIVRVKR